MPLPGAALAALISTGGGLLGGLFSGKGKEQQSKKDYDLWKKQSTQKQSWIDQKFKPQSNYNLAGNLGSLDEIVNKAVLGYMNETMGGSGGFLGNYGINIQDMLGGMKFGSGQSEAPQQRPDLMALRQKRMGMGGSDEIDYSNRGGMGAGARM